MTDQERQMLADRIARIKGNCHAEDTTGSTYCGYRAYTLVTYPAWRDDAMDRVTCPGCLEVLEAYAR